VASTATATTIVAAIQTSTVWRRRALTFTRQFHPSPARLPEWGSTSAHRL